MTPACSAKLDDLTYWSIHLTNWSPLPLLVFLQCLFGTCWHRILTGDPKYAREGAGRNNATRGDRTRAGPALGDLALFPESAQHTPVRFATRSAYLGSLSYAIRISA